MLQKFTSVSKSGKRKEVKQSSVEKGNIGDGGDESGGNKERDGGGDGGKNEEGGVKDGTDGKKEEKVEKEGVKQCLSSKCLVEQLPNTLSVSFKGQLFILSIPVSLFLSFLPLSVLPFLSLRSIFLRHLVPLPLPHHDPHPHPNPNPNPHLPCPHLFPFI